MPLILALLELAALTLAASGALAIASEPWSSDWTGAAPLGQALALGVCCVLALYRNDLYDLGVARSFRDFSVRLPRTITVCLILLAALYGLVPAARVPAGAGAVIPPLMLAALLLVRAASYAVLGMRPFRESVVIFGTGHLARMLAHEIETQPHLRFDVAGLVGEPGSQPPAHLRPAYLGPAEQLDQIIERVGARHVIVALAERRGHLPMRKLIDLRLKGVAVEDGEEVYERLTGRIALESLAPSSLVFGKAPVRSLLRFPIGRPMSLLVSAAGLALTVPLFPLIALAVKLDSPGPVFYLQTRVGLRGRRFRMIKFRTMRPARQEPSAWARDNGDRITGVGRWLRKFRLDELPQFVNILRGDMNLVGPRPHPASNFDLFVEKIPHYELRLTVRPGVTGWAQVRYGYANSLEEEVEKMRYDLFYIKHMSLSLDLRILVETITVVLLGRRADASPALPVLAGKGRPESAHDTAA